MINVLRVIFNLINVFEKIVFEVLFIILVRISLFFNFRDVKNLIC